MRRALLALAAIVFCQPALAQIFPDPWSDNVNDYADMLPEETEAEVVATLEALAEETGAQVVIVTLTAAEFYVGDLSVPDYGTALFNAWGIGDADRGDGVLLIVFRDDRQLRITTGSGYDADAQDIAQDIVGEDILGRFVEDDFPGGIAAGATAIGDRLVRPVFGAAPAAQATGATSGDEDAGGGGGTGLYWLIGLIAVPVLAIIGLNRRSAAKLAATPCASCGATGLTRSRHVLTEPTETTPGQGETRTTCPSCGHVEAEPYTISAKGTPPSDDPKFGGGKTKGDGASGKW